MSEENDKLTPSESVEDSSQQSVSEGKPSFLQDPTETSEASTEQSAAEETEVTIPEKFQGKSVEDIVKSYSELESLQGRQATKLSESLAKEAQLEDKLNHLSELMQTMKESSQQSSRSDKGAEEELDLNELFLERGADVVKQVVREVVGDVLTERDKKQLTDNENFLKQRDTEIESVAGAELQVIASEVGEEGIPTPVMNQIAYIDRTDPELARLRNDPNLTPERVREETRKIYERAVKDVQDVAAKVGGQPTQEQVEAFSNAQKRAASSAPGDSAKGSQSSDKLDPKIEAMKRAGWGFLSERS